MPEDPPVSAPTTPLTTAVTAVPARRNWLWQPNLIVFVSSAAIMILELVASRIIAPIVGSSLYTWTSVIGIVLAGISLGNWLGGRLSDRRASLPVLGLLYLAAALACAGVLGVDAVNRVFPPDIPVLYKLLLLTSALFFIPCTLLGMISPMVAKLAVRSLATAGSTVGNIYAAGALGSIVGTFATGFFLISWFGSFTIILAVALLLLAMGLLFFLGARWPAGLLALALVGCSWQLAMNQGWLTGPCARETNYYCIKVIPDQMNGEPIKQLVLDHLVHSYVSLTNPRLLVYPYEKAYANIADYRARHDQKLDRVLMIGGGGYTFARYVEATYPNAAMHVIEIDPDVTKFAYDELALPRTSRILTYNEDARLFFAGEPTTRYDLVLGDAFNHFSVPYHLTTREFNERVRAWMADDGLYVVNIIDGPYGEFVRAYYHTLKLTFRHVYLGEGNGEWRKASRSTFLLIATDKPLDLPSLVNYDAGTGDALLSRMIAPDSEIQRLLTEATPVTLTDQYAPVDQMLAGVFREEVPR